MELNLDSNIDDGMEQSLPSSATSSRHSLRSGTPMESTCKRRQDLNYTAKVYFEGVTTTKRTTEGYRRNGHEDDNPLIIDQLRQLAAYEEYVQRAISELSSLPLVIFPAVLIMIPPHALPLSLTSKIPPYLKILQLNVRRIKKVSPRLPHVN
ncbi:hypothetical protein TNCV_1174661 [Trichonephila clavipes]|nr:hypothetical protein TNCV_1174661 [Trichonephila clavipes]